MVKLTILSLQQMILIISTKNNSFINSNILPRFGGFGKSEEWMGNGDLGFVLGWGNAKDERLGLVVFGVGVGILGLEFFV